MKFLDITMDLTTGTFQTFRKPNNSPLYMNSKPNHPYHITKNLPITINKRLSKISSNENVFKNEYQDALRNSGYNTKLNFEKNNEQKKRTKNNRNRNVPWYNPPFNMALKLI